MCTPLVNVAFNDSLAYVNALARKGIVNNCETPPPFQLNTIVIDAGHGGKDPGCSGKGSVEKHIALAIAKTFRNKIEAQYPHLEVILTREEDVFIPLYERAAIANRAQADLFVSIHCNALPTSPATWGSETYVMGLHTAEHNLDVAKRENEAILLEADYEQNYDYDPNSPEGHILLSMFQNAFLEQSILFAERVEYHYKTTAGRRSRGVKQAGFVVLKETAMPSVLVETGFLTSSKDEAFLLTDEGQELVATALLEAFSDYKNILEGENGGPDADLPDIERRIPTSAAASSSPVVQTPAPTRPPASTPSSYATNAPAPRADNYGIQTEARIQNTTPSHQGTVSAPVPAANRARQTGQRGDTSWAEDIGRTPATQTNKGAAASSSPSALLNPGNVYYCVQLAASPKPLDLRDPKWQNSGYLIEVHEESGLLKYQVRNLKSTAGAFAARSSLQQTGFPDAFIVAYRDGQRISLGEAEQLLGE
ncbi:MAG: N-acetylmuramoyl-L-alanine amidase [Bacteroidota bacterium]